MALLDDLVWRHATKAYDQILHHDKYRPVLAISIGKRSDDDINQPTITPKQRRSEVFL